MLSVVALMVLLLPVLLRTTTSQKLTSIPLSIHESSGDLPPLPADFLKSVTVYREADGFRVRTETRGRDARDQGAVEITEYHPQNLDELQERLSEIRQLDDQQDRVILVPSNDTQTTDLIRWMDAVRVWPEGRLFPQVVLASEGFETEAITP